jgi:hypothetical protein
VPLFNECGVGYGIMISSLSLFIFLLNIFQIFPLLYFKRDMQIMLLVQNSKEKLT